MRLTSKSAPGACIINLSKKWSGKESKAHDPLMTAILAVNVVNFTSVKRADVYLTDLLNIFVP